MIISTDFNKDTVAEMLCKRAAFLPDTNVYYFPENKQVYNWREIYTQTRAIAESLISIGVKKGDRVALLMEGRMEVVLSIFAVASIGAIAVPINTYSKKDEIKTVLRDANTVALLMGPKGHHLNYREIVKEIVDEATIHNEAWLPAHIYILDDEAVCYPFKKFSELLSRRNSLDDKLYITACAGTFANDPILLIYTSGTTGTPKGVLRSVASFLIPEKKAKNKNSGIKERTQRVIDRLSNRFKLMHLLPLYHLGGISTLFTSLKTSNFKVVMLSHFNPLKAIEVINSERCGFLIGTPYMIQNLMNYVSADANMFNTIKGISFAAAAVNSRLIDKITTKFKKLSFFTVSYGSSEAGVVANGTCILSNSNDILISFFLKFFSRVGLLSGVIKLKEFSKTPYSIGGTVDRLVQVKIRDVVSGDLLPAGQQGEIIVKGPRVMRYVHDAQSKESFLSDGWYRSGDLGYLDERGLLVITGRIKRQISRGGEKISPVEIEVAIAKNPQVADCFVLGLPDELYGEEICAALVAKNGIQIDVDKLRAQLQTSLSAFKVPRHFVILPELPLSLTGKVAINDVKALISSQHYDGKTT